MKSLSCEVRPSALSRWLRLAVPLVWAGARVSRHGSPCLQLSLTAPTSSSPNTCVCFCAHSPIFSVQVTWSADSPGTMGIQKQGLLALLMINVRLPCAPLSWRCRCECYLAHASRSDVTVGIAAGERGWWNGLNQQLSYNEEVWHDGEDGCWLVLKRKTYSTWLQCTIFKNTAETTRVLFVWLNNEWLKVICANKNCIDWNTILYWKKIMRLL